MEGYSRLLLLLLTIHYGSTVPTPLDQLTLNINLKDGHSHQERGLLNDYAIANVNGNENEGNDNGNTNEGNFNGNSNIGNENGNENFGNDNGNENLGNVNGNDNWGESNGNLNEGNDNGNENEGNVNGNNNEGNDNGNENLGNYNGYENLLNHNGNENVGKNNDTTNISENNGNNNGPGKGYGFRYRKGYGRKYQISSWKGKNGGYGKGRWKGKYGGCGNGKGCRGQTESTQNCQCGKVNGIPDPKYDRSLNYTGCFESHTRHAHKHTRHTRPEISGGSQAIPNQYPFMAQFIAILKNSTWYKPDFCGGTLISNKHIITAFHCFNGITSTWKGSHFVMNESYIKLGSHKITYELSQASEKSSEEASERKYYIKDIKYPPGARCIGSNVFCEHDIAIIVLKTTVEFTKNISPICLPQPNEKIDHKLKMISIGWGNICNARFSTNVGPEELKHVQVELIDISGFDRAALNFNNVTNFLVAHNSIIAEKKQGPRKGDSGGPLIQQIKVTDLLHYKLIGVVSGYTPTSHDARYDTSGTIHDLYSAINPVVMWIEQTVASEPGSYICKTRI